MSNLQSQEIKISDLSPSPFPRADQSWLCYCLDKFGNIMPNGEAYITSIIQRTSRGAKIRVLLSELNRFYIPNSSIMLFLHIKPKEIVFILHWSWKEIKIMQFPLPPPPPSEIGPATTVAKEAVSRLEILNNALAFSRWLTVKVVVWLQQQIKTTLQETLVHRV